MKKFAGLLVLGLFAAGLATVPPPRAVDAQAGAAAAKGTDIKWTEDYKAALETAKKDKKMVLLDFTGSDWCPPCKALNATVLTSDAFAQWTKDTFVLVDLDYPRAKPQDDATKKQNADLAKQYGIEGYPTIIILNSDGKEIGRQVGYGGEKPDEFIAAREKEIKAAK